VLVAVLAVLPPPAAVHSAFALSLRLIAARHLVALQGVAHQLHRAVLLRLVALRPVARRLAVPSR
jgi:hypothetical protein